MAAVRRAQAIGAECLQVFVGSPKAWAAPSLDSSVAERFRAAAVEAGVYPVFIHAAYLLNPASADESLFQRSLSSLVNSLQWAEALAAAGVVTHLGSPAGADPDEAEDRAVRAFVAALTAVPGARLLLETSAGQKRVGGHLAQLGRLVERLSLYHNNVGVCLDTAHLYASGYDVATAKGLEATLEEVEQRVGMARVELVHVNDSKAALGHGTDRHANAGEGYIGESGLRRILRHRALGQLPFITEAPGFHGNGPDAENLAILKRLAYCDS